MGGWRAGAGNGRWPRPICQTLFVHPFHPAGAFTAIMFLFGQALASFPRKSGGLRQKVNLVIQGDMPRDMEGGGGGWEAFCLSSHRRGQRARLGPGAACQLRSAAAECGRKFAKGGGGLKTRALSPTSCGRAELCENTEGSASRPFCRLWVGRLAQVTRPA